MNADLESQLRDYFVKFFDIKERVYLSVLSMSNDMRYDEDRNTIFIPILYGKPIIEFAKNEGFFIEDVIPNALYKVSISC